MKKVRIAPASLVVTLFLVLAPTGCVKPQDDPRISHLAHPPDFALEFTVHGSARETDRTRVQSRYVLLPNRRLHVALGPDAVASRFPHHYLLLNPAAFETVVDVVQDGRLPTEPTSPNAERFAGEGRGVVESGQVIYEVAVTGWGRMNRFATTAEESPQTHRLLEHLIILTGGDLPVAAEAAPPQRPAVAEE